MSACLLITIELRRTNSEYEYKLKAGGTKNSTMFALCWDIDELSRLRDDLQGVRVDIGSLLEVLFNPTVELEYVNIPSKVGAIREKLVKIMKSVTRFKRIPATHIFIVMLSCELRDHKPYAIPVQCLPCKVLKESEIRRIINNVLKEMTARKMSGTGEFFILLVSMILFKLMIGFVCNGEFNYLRSRGYTRPLSILQIRTQVKKKYSKMSKSTLISMLSPKRINARVIAS